MSEIRLGVPELVVNHIEGPGKIDKIRRAMIGCHQVAYPMTDEPFTILEITPTIDCLEYLNQGRALELLHSGQFSEVVYSCGGVWVRMSKEEWDSLGKTQVGSYVWEPPCS